MSDGAVTGSLPELLGSRAGERGPGLITATRRKLRRLFCLEGGDLVFAVSNLVEEQFLERLVRSGRLAPGDRAAIQREVTRTGRKPAGLMIEAGIVDPHALREEMAGHLRTWIAEGLTWNDGTFRFDAGRPDLTDEATCTVPITEVILGHVRTHPATVDAVRVRIGPPDLILHRDAGAGRALDGVVLDDTLRHLLDSCERPTTLGDVAGSAPGGAEAAFRGIYGLLLLRVLRRGDTASATAAATGGTRAEREVSREEIEGWIVRTRSATHYEVLGVSPTASSDDIREAYYRHARRFHPDRIRSGPFRDLLGQVEDFFAKVTEAHNTLSHAERRSEYDNYLTEIAARTETEETKDTAYLARQNFLRAKASLERRRFTEAMAFLENAVRLDGGEADYRRELGRVLALNPRRREEAEDHLRQAIEIDPSAVASYLALADLYARWNRREHAGAALREALRWEAGNAEVLAKLKELGFDPGGSDGGLLGGLFGR